MYEETSKLDIRWKITVGEMKHWWDSSKLYMEEAQLSLLDIMFDNAVAVADCVSNFVPWYDRIVSDDCYHPKQALKNLVRGINSDELSKFSGELFRCMAAAGAMYSAFKVPGEITNNTRFMEKYSISDCSYKSAKKLMFVIAAIKILQTLAGPEQASQVETMLQRKQWLPKTIVDALEAKAKGAPTMITKAKATTTKSTATATKAA